MNWRIQDKMNFFFSMLFLLLVTFTLFSVVNLIGNNTIIEEETNIRLSPSQDNSQLLSQTRGTYLLTIISVTALFMGLFYYAVIWPKKK